jgi:16S rRNA (cytosine1402-N4)-methyltransferase|tara:strand:- start:2108 stop:3004 length:897 start_codon:yes stop_codon:yes gene_type:complete
MKPYTVQDSALTHVPVMSSEVLTYLDIKSNGVYIDGTIGPGGHAIQILNNLGKHGKLIGIDRDEDALKICNKNCSSSSSLLSLFHSSYNKINTILTKEKISSVNGIILDLGLSSNQLNSRSRGFSYRSEGNLDMRFDFTQGKKASDIIKSNNIEKLTKIFKKYGEERFSYRIARSIKEMKDMKTVNHLKEAIRRCTPPKNRDRILARIFQSLRIVVNDELEILQDFLLKFVDFLSPNGKIVIISYHSLEDRLVKHQFKHLSNNGLLKILTKKPIRSSEKEINNNRRSKNAKLRAAEKV